LRARVALSLSLLLAAFFGAVPVHACHGGSGSTWQVAGGHAHEGSCRRAVAACSAEGCDGCCPEAPSDESPCDTTCCVDVRLDAGVLWAAVALALDVLRTALPLVPAAARFDQDPETPEARAGPPGVECVVLLR
jgi:hypothetical protein